MAQFIYRKRPKTDTAYVEVIAQDGDPLTPDEALIVALKDLGRSLELFATPEDSTPSK